MNLQLYQLVQCCSTRERRESKTSYCHLTKCMIMRLSWLCISLLSTFCLHYNKHTHPSQPYSTLTGCPSTDQQLSFTPILSHLLFYKWTQSRCALRMPLSLSYRRTISVRLLNFCHLLICMGGGLMSWPMRYLLTHTSHSCLFSLFYVTRGQERKNKVSGILMNLDGWMSTKLWWFLFNSFLRLLGIKCIFIQVYDACYHSEKRKRWTSI